MNFFARSNKQSQFTVALALLLTMAVELLLPLSIAKSQSRPQGPALLPGQTATRLPDGRWLFIGGENTGRSLEGASIWNPATGTTTQIPGGLQQRRAWHTATVLPEGQVLIFGGIGVNGRALQSAELFDPETAMFSNLAIEGLSARARHTATLLTDGHVLIAGGIDSSGQTLPTADLWNSEDGLVRVLSPLSSPRRDHTSTLLSDGRVLLWGGNGSSGLAQNNGEIFDLSSAHFTLVASFPTFLFPSASEASSLVDSIPPDRMVNVPADALIAIRFSKPLRAETVTNDTVILSGPSGVERVKIVIAEDGKLVFITPESLLLPGATYSVTVNGARDRDALLVPPSGFSFATLATTGPSSSANSSTQSGLRVVQQPTESTAQAKTDDDDDWVWKGAKKNGKPHSPWQDLSPLRAGRGETAVAGQVLDLKGEPLPNVTLKMAGEYGDESVTVKTDDTGRFLLTEIKEGDSALLIDGRSANKPGRSFGIFEVYVKVKEGETNVLPYTVWMPRIDTAHAVKIDSPTKTEVILTTPKIPNLEVHLPAGSVIKDIDGNLVKEVGITPMPLDRPPFALPPRDVKPPAFFTVQPGVARIYSPTRGARLIYPNYTENPKPPRSRFDSWHYDAAHRGWYIYGQGSVTEGGKQVVPDPGVSVYKFTGAMIGADPAPPSDGPKGGPKSGDPVDLATGLFVLTKVDLIVYDVISLPLTRTYRQNDNASRPFGIGSTHPYNIYLYSTNDYQDADLILPDGGRVHYVRISPGIGFTDAIYESTTRPGVYYKSKLAWNGQGWSITLKDGTIFKFPESCPGCPTGGLNLIQDRNGNKITISRTGLNDFDDPVGNITQITTQNGRWIKFSYDSNNRITEARDNSNRTVTYEYDTGGRLFRVTDPIGGVTEYTYDTSNRMLTIKDPRTIVYLTNEYDTAGRVKKQTTADGAIYQFAYTTDANGEIIETDITDPRNNIHRYTFNSDGYVTGATFAVGKPEQQVIAINRQTGTNLPLSVTDALNRTTTLVYDTSGNITSVTGLFGTPQAATYIFTYEPAFNQIATITNPLNKTTTFSYNATGNLASVTNPFDQTITFGRNTSGQVTSATSPLAHTSQFSWDGGDLVGFSNPLGKVTSRFVDGVGRGTSVTNPLGNTSKVEFDALSRVVKRIDAFGNVSLFEYDPNGNLLNTTDPRNAIRSYTYNNMDRIETATDPLLRGSSYQYDLRGNLATFTDAKNQIRTYSYDALNRLSGVTFADNSWITFAYDSGNRLTQLNDSISGLITRTYDGFNRILSETTPKGTVSYTYDALGQRATMSVPGQSDVVYTYDDANRLTQITQGSAVTSFVYDADGRRISKTLPNGTTTDYTYDAGARITDTTFRNGPTILGNLAYQYNDLGRVETTSGSYARTLLPSAINTSNYDSSNQQLGFGGNNYTFDNNGNRLTNTGSSGTINYTWNTRNQLTGVSGPGISAIYAYDGLGRLQSATVNGSLTEFLYDGAVPIQESAGATIVANNLTFPGINEFLTRIDASGTNYFVTDKSLSTIALANAGGIIQTEYTYNIFGGASSITGISSSNPYQFRGSSTDATGLRRVLRRGGGAPLDPFSMTQLNLQPPKSQNRGNGDPNQPSPPKPPSPPTGGSEGGRKGGGGSGDGGEPDNGEPDSGEPDNGDAAKDQSPIQPPKEPPDPSTKLKHPLPDCITKDCAPGHEPPMDDDGRLKKDPPPIVDPCRWGGCFTQDGKLYDSDYERIQLQKPDLLSQLLQNFDLSRALKVGRGEP